MIREAKEINCPESTYKISQRIISEDDDDFSVEESFAKTLGKTI
jgi:hypothetical protein